MTELIPFKASTPIRIWAKLITAAEWRLQFRLQDHENSIMDGLHAGHWASWSRGDELWKSTCLEAFWGIAGQSSYWELNLSPARQLWNLYRFDDYRSPQPPVQSEQFQIKDISATSSDLSCTLVPGVSISNLEFSLTAIVQTRVGPLYFAAHHAGVKPDFHMRKSFVFS